jgi:hypothetical protein
MPKGGLVHGSLPKARTTKPEPSHHVAVNPTVDNVAHHKRKEGSP